MRLRVLLPFRVFADMSGVNCVVAETTEGTFGLLPHRLDCVAALVPGILSYQSEVDGEAFMAVDQGVLMKVGDRVTVCVRRAIAGADLAGLRDAVQQDYLSLSTQEQDARDASGKLESGFVSRFAKLHHE
ncbi:MAG: F0F1 ATP synthase subunit epsilon [Gammaproteobacteria bacterium]|nr:F0F1 ATP synthase subunit epsilon [Gammaproteobacteria bacterium]MBU1440722.1 F0F1 ATP synthase subunit epsilon [Gammaproteobacteria bacterium]MBU2287234.1 F0F1 ATP synthase subunit epsilon [Gammaproteobacteria bacterium]MBU2409526.1 F0F1 ATP synthase subunit epsilon [Gammaproteobacteria bacterium]